MDATPETLTIGIPIYDLVDPLDVAGPYEVFSNVTIGDKRALRVLVLAEKAGKDVSVPTRFGLELVPQAAFDEVEHLDVLWVPGGDPKALNRLMKGGPYLDALKRWSTNARLVTSVCEGAMLLAAAGLLNGYRATTHWAFIRCFARFPGIDPVPLNPDDPECQWPRFVVDRNRVTGGGISSSLDEALQVVLMLFGQQVAESVQVTIQYFPDPPVQGAIPVPPGCPLDSA
ncbi:MAG TPA: DJ-1/PfpI family protein [Longimicrobium sp.]|nr:DJ-1/PfpI family protein [Longimicrobium sp.]